MSFVPSSLMSTSDERQMSVVLGVPGGPAGQFANDQSERGMRVETAA
jgi:hypothetical protein